MFKEFDGCKLTIPKDSFVKYILQMEDVFVNGFNHNIESRYKPVFVFHYAKACINGEIPRFPYTYLNELFTKMRLHYALKFGNQELVLE